MNPSLTSNPESRESEEERDRESAKECEKERDRERESGREREREGGRETCERCVDDATRPPVNPSLRPLLS